MPVTLSPHDAAGRVAAARRDHTYVDAAGAVHERAWFTEEEARRAAFGIQRLTGRRYRHYRCRDERCGGWHIRPKGKVRRLRPEDLARPA